MRVIPKGWLKYQAMGERVAGTKMVPFKVPLTEDVCVTKMPDDQWFTPAILLQRHPGLKIIIDLTDTARYYDPQEFAKEGVAHVKIRITGGGALPPLRKLQLFFKTVDEFMKKYAHDPEALVGVHCTHGLNRTGYFICHYMVDRLDMSPDDAISRFEAARGHTMHRMNYINEIRRSKGKVTQNLDEQATHPDPRKGMEYNSPLGDNLHDHSNEYSRRRTIKKRRRTNEDWRKRKDESRGKPVAPNLRNFNRIQSREKHSRGEKSISTNPCEKETTHASSSGNWRDRP